jgi:hypothetical protein
MIIKKDTSCISDIFEDCFTVDRINIPEISEILYVVKDTTKVKEFKKRSIRMKKLNKEGGFKVWREVICEKDADLIHEVLKALALKGYDVNEGINTFDMQSQNALIKYQQENNLAFGNLDIETLKHLKINY